MRAVAASPPSRPVPRGRRARAGRRSDPDSSPGCWARGRPRRRHPRAASGVSAPYGRAALERSTAGARSFASEIATGSSPAQRASVDPSVGTMSVPSTCWRALSARIAGRELSHRVRARPRRAGGSVMRVQAQALDCTESQRSTRTAGRRMPKRRRPCPAGRASRRGRPESVSRDLVFARRTISTWPALPRPRASDVAYPRSAAERERGMTHLAYHPLVGAQDSVQIVLFRQEQVDEAVLLLGLE